MKTLLTAALLFAAAGNSGLVSAGEIENLSSGAKNEFARTELSGSAFLLTTPAQAVPVETSGTSEYKKLATAFEKGTVPAKADLAGWNAGRFIDKDLTDCANSLLMAGIETPLAAGNIGTYKIVPLTLYGTPDFYERLSADLVGGVAIILKEHQTMWTTPVFGPAEVTFEMIMPSYNKGFSRYAVRKAADNRILVKHTWKDIMGPGAATEGAFYGYFTKNVTPK